MTYKNGSNAPTNAFLATNRLTTGGAGYDNNGSLTSYRTGSFAMGYGDDIENRKTVAVAAGASTETLFGYDASNQLIYQGTYNTATASYSNERTYLYGADGKKLVAFNLQVSGGNCRREVLQVSRLPRFTRGRIGPKSNA